MAIKRIIFDNLALVVSVSSQIFLIDRCIARGLPFPLFYKQNV